MLHRQTGDTRVGLRLDKYVQAALALLASFCQILGNELTSPEIDTRGQNLWTKVKISFLAKISNLLKFFRKSTCSSDKFPDLAFGPSNYLPNISRRPFSIRIVIKHLIKFCPASGSLRLSEARTVSQLSTR